MTDVGQQTSQPTGFAGGLGTVIATLQNIVRAINNLGEQFAGSFATLAGNNTFTGSNFFDGAIGFGTRVVTAAGAVTMSATDIVIIVNKTVGAATTVTLVASPATDRLCCIKDGKGDTLTNPITIVPAAGTIDDVASVLIATPYQKAWFIYDGNQWRQL